VEIHHADLGLAFTADDWDEGFVRTELDRWGPGAGARLLDGGGLVVATTDTAQSWTAGDVATAHHVEAPARTVLEWLVGRRTDGLPALAPWSW
jgi:hypothetical protein